MVAAQTPDRFRQDIRRSKGIPEDVTGQPIVVYMRSWEIDAAQPCMQGTLLSEFLDYLDFDKTASRPQHLRADCQFGPVCEIVLPIREQVRSASARAVTDPATEAIKTGRYDSQRCNQGGNYAVRPLRRFEST
mgnify:FL=1